MRGRLMLLALFGIASWNVSSEAANLAREATTDLSKVDADFHLQGEYLGRAGNSHFDTPHMGLQVIALGEGQFDANLLRGGLPGAGWDRTTKTKLSGGRNDELLLLIGGEYHIEVSPQEAIVQTSQGDELARLQKIHRVSVTQDAPPPSNAIVLFDGSSTDQFENGKITPDGLLDMGAMTKLAVSDFQLHIEFRTPYMPKARGQGRGNSGVYIQQRYEVQVLDSFGLEGVENECGGLYKQKRPDVNMAFPPLSWQTYDIDFRAARWDSEGKRSDKARITVRHNGEPIHDDYEILAKTGAGKPESPEPRPILFQNHGDPVRYRNMWIVATGPTVVPEAAPVATIQAVQASPVETLPIQASPIEASPSQTTLLPAPFVCPQPPVVIWQHPVYYQSCVRLPNTCCCCKRRCR